MSQRSEPEDFVLSPAGELDYGEITLHMGRAMRRQAGKIRLQQGVQNADGKGWGLAHIEARHGREISKAGFSTAQEFVAHIASNFQQVWQIPGSRQLLVATNDTHHSIMFVQLVPAAFEDFYRVNTAFPVKRGNYEIKQGMQKIWDGSDPAKIVPGQRSAFAAAPEAALRKTTSDYPDKDTQSGQPHR